MSQNRLSPFNGPMDLSTAQKLAAEFLEKRKRHFGGVDFFMTAGTGEGAGQTGDPGSGGQSGTEGGTGGAGGDAGNSNTGGGTDSGGDPQKKIQALEEEKDRHYQARKTAEEELEKYKQAEDERKRASQDELTNTKQDLEKAQQRIAELETQLTDQMVNNAFLTENTHQWQNPSRVLQLVDRSAVEIKDGKVVGVKEALDALAKSDAYLLKPAEDNGGGGGGNGQRSGDQHNGRRDGDKQGPSREDLAKKYPALRR